LAQAGVRQIVVQRPAGLQQLRPGQLIATQQAAVPRAAVVNTVQPVPAASVQNQPKKGLSLTVCDTLVSSGRQKLTKKLPTKSLTKFF